MRENKYRAWDINKRQMYYEQGMSYSFDAGSYCISNLGVYRDREIINDTPEQESDILKELIPMQFTGLKDKNEIEIYEGDIVLF